MIYDCFTFFNELDILELRLNILNDVVDKFVLVEATKTFSNEDKPLYYEENKQRFKQFEDKIVHIVIDKYPPVNNAWVIENYQRNMIAEALHDCNENDVIIISDLDEIPNPDKILEYKDKPGIKAFNMKMFNCFLNNYSEELWNKSKMVFYKDFKHILDDYNEYSLTLQNELNQGTTATKIRIFENNDVEISDGGWHFTFIGNPEKISYKIKVFAHQELNKEEFTSPEKIMEKMKTGEDLFGRPQGFSPVKVISPDFPEYLVKNVEKYKDYIIQNPKYTINQVNTKRKVNHYLSKFICIFVPFKGVRTKIKKYFRENIR